MRQRKKLLFYVFILFTIGQSVSFADDFVVQKKQAQNDVVPSYPKPPPK